MKEKSTCKRFILRKIVRWSFVSAVIVILITCVSFIKNRWLDPVFATNKIAKNQSANTHLYNPESSIADSKNGTKPQKETFAIRGVVEGFYGTPWTGQQRIDMLKFMGENHFTTYVYAPKDDPYQRTEWAKPYPPTELETIKTLVENAKADGIEFVYSISPGIPEPLPNQILTKEAEKASITYTSKSDQKQLLNKIDQLRSIGIHTFMLSFDDVEKYVKNEDRAVYGQNYAQAHVDLANLVYDTETNQDPKFQLWFVPTVYYGLQDNPYWKTIRTTLNSEIHVIWTGVWILNQNITSSDVEHVEVLLGRKPLLWDNFPVNDYTYVVKKKPALFMGPIENRSPDLFLHLSGYMANPMIQSEASKVALGAIGHYLYDPYSYQPEAVWKESIRTMRGVEDPNAFELFCSFATESVLRKNGNEKFINLWHAYRTHDKTSDNTNSEQALRKELSDLADLPATLHTTIRNSDLVSEIDPWLLKLGSEGKVGLQALDYMKMSGMDPHKVSDRQQITQQLQQLENNPLNIGNEIIQMIDDIMQAH
jgi:hyaluronoglucosaminidase